MLNDTRNALLFITQRNQPSTWRGRSEQILHKQVGCEPRKNAGVGVAIVVASSCSQGDRFKGSNSNREKTAIGENQT